MTTTSPGTYRSALSKAWTVEDSAHLYQTSAWGMGYFAISDAGHVVVRPDTTPRQEIDLLELVDSLKQRDLRPPVLLRFTDVLAHRLQYLSQSFKAAIAENNYTGKYIAVYPVKVNQQRPVVEEIYRHGGPMGYGLEVGSKPELLAVLALTEQSPDRLIVCNGFKDSAYLEAVVWATKLGRNVIPVVENGGELRLILKHAKAIGVRPNLGVRVKLASQGAGRWRESAGERSKFGLAVSEVVDQMAVLRAEGMEDCLKLLHCHPGSQIQDVRRVKDAVGELAHVYVELRRMGAGLQYIDVGGGLGVDYDGSRTDFPSSMNYSVEEYASEVVYRIGAVCNEMGVDHPTIVSESGRAIAAYQSVLVFDVLGTTGLNRFQVADRATEGLGTDEETPQPIRDLFDAYESVSERRLLECYHDAMQARESAQQLFNLGYLSLELRGLADRLFWATCAKVREICKRLPAVPDELADLESILAETYFCNFSVFQSLPDSWAIGHLFPIMPIHRLDEEPTRRAVLADITCDSDGRIERFCDVRDINRTLPLHTYREGEPYYLAAFLVGAYQETLGDLHNLFGDTHVVHLSLHEGGGWWIDEVVRGDTAAEVLTYVQYDPRQLQINISRDCERAVRDGRMTVAESQALLRFYKAELDGYTYLSPE